MRCTTMNVCEINKLTSSQDYAHEMWFYFSETELDIGNRNMFSPSQQNRLIKPDTHVANICDYLITIFSYLAFHTAVLINA